MGAEPRVTCQDTSLATALFAEARPRFVAAILRTPPPPSWSRPSYVHASTQRLRFVGGKAIAHWQFGGDGGDGGAVGADSGADAAPVFVGLGGRSSNNFKQRDRHLSAKWCDSKCSLTESFSVVGGLDALLGCDGLHLLRKPNWCSSPGFMSMKSSRSDALSFASSLSSVSEPLSTSSLSSAPLSAPLSPAPPPCVAATW
mmetsp:Transcript_221/g.585  ORF Transcript_221/g.585 Transcript_221/m.585 type:complete len:200 (+) Transcript_221:108-707(+)